MARKKKVKLENVLFKKGKRFVWKKVEHDVTRKPKGLRFIKAGKVRIINMKGKSVETIRKTHNKYGKQGNKYQVKFLPDGWLYNATKIRVQKGRWEYYYV